MNTLSEVLDDIACGFDASINSKEYVTGFVMLDKHWILLLNIRDFVTWSWGEHGVEHGVNQEHSFEIYNLNREKDLTFNDIDIKYLSIKEFIWEKINKNETVRV